MRDPERKRGEIDYIDLLSFSHTFIPRYDRYPLQMGDGSYIAKKQILSLTMLEDHFSGKITLGAYALNADNLAKWICFDADDAGEFAGLKQLARSLESDGVPNYLEASRRGGHLWLFIEPLSGRDTRRFGKYLLQRHGLDTVELYPKQDELRQGPGSLVRLPLGKHRKSQKRYYFITHEGTPLAPTIRDQIHLLAHPRQVPRDYIESVLLQVPKTRPAVPSPMSGKGSVQGSTTLSERIKNRISVSDFVTQYVELRNGTGLCPFHDDHAQSFGVNEEGNYWHCFAGCGGGSLIDFWMKMREVQGKDPGFTATVTELAQMLL